MAISRIDRTKDRLLAAQKWCLSFRKQVWEFDDYPVSIRKQEADPADLAFSAPRFKHYRYSASIPGWLISAGGDTPEEAKAELAKNFEAAKKQRAREGKDQPRPGVNVPIEFASQDRVNKHEALSEDFVRRILELEWAWLSDESSLWHFHTDENNNRLNARIMEVYGVDVSDLEDGKLSEILDRIALSRMARRECNDVERHDHGSWRVT